MLVWTVRSNDLIHWATSPHPKQKLWKLFSFPNLRLGTYLMKVNPETWHGHYLISTFSLTQEIISAIWDTILLLCYFRYNNYSAPEIIWLSNLSILSVRDESYCRNASCALNMISTLLLQTYFDFRTYHIYTDHMFSVLFQFTASDYPGIFTLLYFKEYVSLYILIYWAQEFTYFDLRSYQMYIDHMLF